MVEDGLRRRRAILRQRSLLWLTLGWAACTSADGEVFRASDGSSGLPCVQAPFLIQKGVPTSVAVAGIGNAITVVAQVQDEARLYRVSLSTPTATPLVSAFVVGRSGYTYGVAPAGGGGPLWMVFHNHSLAGQWRVYGAAWDEITGLDESLLTLSNDGNESIGPKAAWLGTRLGVAFRQDAQLAFVVAEGSSILGRDLGPEALPHPVVERVLVRQQGFVVSHRRTQSALAFYDAEAKAEGIVELPSSVADITVVGSALVGIVAVPSGLQRLTFDASGATLMKPVMVNATNVNVLRVGTQSNHVAVAFLESENTPSARLHFFWNQGDGNLVYPGLAVPQAADLEVVSTTQGALVTYRTDSALMGRFYCSATIP